MTTLVLVAIGAIVLVAFVVVLHRLARDNEPVDELVLRLDQKMAYELTPSEYYERYGLAAYHERYGKRHPSNAEVPVASWREQERLRKKHREQERARKRRQKNRKGGRS